MKTWFVSILFVAQCFTLSAQGATVVCIHGFLSTSASMRSIEKALCHMGLKVYDWKYPSRARTFEEHACVLVSYLQKIACAAPGEPIYFVTHSSAALILRATLNLPSCPEEAKIGRAVLLAPPNQGSYLARRFHDFSPIQWILGPNSGWQLMNYDACDIQALGTFPETMDLLVIAGTKGNKMLFDGPNDGWISIDETALDTPYYWKCFHVTHGELLTNRQALCYLRTFLLRTCLHTSKSDEKISQKPSDLGV